jgi:hypothetical protein
MIKKIKLTERDLRNIVKRIIKEGEEEKNSYYEKMMEFISTNGILYVIDFMGGLDEFSKKLPEYIDNKENKIKIIKEIVNYFKGKTDDYRFYLENDITIAEGFDPETNTGYITMVTSLNEEDVYVYTYEIDEGGYLSDDPTSQYYINYEDMYFTHIDSLFDELVDMYF